MKSADIFGLIHYIQNAAFLAGEGTELGKHLIRMEATAREAARINTVAEEMAEALRKIAVIEDAELFGSLYPDLDWATISCGDDLAAVLADHAEKTLAKWYAVKCEL